MYVTLANNIQEAEHPFNTYLPEPVPFSFYLTPTSLEEIKSNIQIIKDSSPGHDDINMKVIKACCDSISPLLVFIINKSFQEGTFPDHLKIARIVPISKKGDNSLPKNYRPISILPSLSKIFEKVIAIRLTNYLSKHSILTSSQYGFRPNFLQI